MARNEPRPITKLRSTPDSGCTCVTRENRRNDPGGRMVLRTFAPEVRRHVDFRDGAAGFAFLTRPTATSDRTVEGEGGHACPSIDVEISSRSHPSCTGTVRVLDTADRVERFQRSYGSKP
ncbi:50S ribosomal protein L33 [Streptomyces sp. DSM 40907]|uniref:50S ribosomal protein L33 n=1 Tax=Streptomyces kutzneri TaxID=3051179 RepID=UPI0028D7F07A|nr:50S ribosomal protein L33 [Streptomyces sp. DSM 40907]